MGDLFILLVYLCIFFAPICLALALSEAYDRYKESKREKAREKKILEELNKRGRYVNKF